MLSRKILPEDAGILVPDHFEQTRFKRVLILVLQLWIDASLVNNHTEFLYKSV